MARAGGVSSDHGVNPANIIAHVPLRFWFCRNAGLYLPLIALQYHEVKVITTFTSLTNLTLNAAALWADYVYLDTDERRRFAQVSHEYLIEQVQHATGSNVLTHDINFNHPVKELIWTGAYTANNGALLPLDAGNYKLKLNGHDRFEARPRDYFTKVQVYEHHTGTPVRFDEAAMDDLANAKAGEASAAYIAVYSFALKPEEHQPSGTCNFSRIDNAQLVAPAQAILELYAVNYNVLRIMSGMGGLAYSN